jgi:hypothetical protein
MEPEGLMWQVVDGRLVFVPRQTKPQRLALGEPQVRWDVVQLFNHAALGKEAE